MTYDDVCAVLVTRGDTDMSFVDDLPYGEVIVWDNSQKPFNHKVYGRYLAAGLTKRPFVYFQDDDVRFTNHQALLDAYEPGVLVANMYDEWIESCGYFDLALVGLGSIMDRGLWLPAHQRYELKYTWDDRFDLDCDFVFGALTPFKRIDFGHEILDIASADNRLWKQDGQLEGKWRTIRRARTLRQVVLTVMAKNEAENITRMLDSVEGWVDKVLLVNTGSTDDTVQVVESWCGARGKWLEVDDVPFTTFKDVRQHMLERGRELAEYQLLMDADEEMLDAGDRPELFADGYMLYYDYSVEYAQARLIASRFPWVWENKVHSCLGIDHDTFSPAVATLPQKIKHHGDGRHADVKLKRDIELLTEEINAGNQVPRHLFLRGKAYEGLGLRDDAIADYHARIEYEENDEEKFFCRYRLGVLTVEHLGDFATGADHLMTAYIERPTRIETLRALAHYCTAVADAAPYPEDDILLVHRHLYTATPTGRS